MRPIDIARKLNISTSTLRNYETQGIVPPTERLSSGYRIYTEEHVAYFECILAMAPGFGMEVTSEVLRKLQVKDIHYALWIVKEKEAQLYDAQLMAKRAIESLQSHENNSGDKSLNEKWMTIGEVARETGIPSSTIRHWEKVGLITQSRDPKNGYRKFNSSHVRKMMLILTLRSSVYSSDLVSLKGAIKTLDHNNMEQMKEIAIHSLEYLNNMTKLQLRGMHYLYVLCKRLSLLD
ncbi:MerR family DNA-binding transcriptional regulator [Paenibacillus sp. GSMTC-2017]|uniref:MerR family DNA-binding transcriptional regulator n=1 Tax=Paenibacillus sp. GSMTC-2017 TaxID=2794350 RepID=UPI0018D828EF|nr:MerR family DNA-binding transcriptional regulator [Paenibacillus sp. GSMTC-2017]MBH5320198.1 MerR family DNA-binding transcriptional regulator [Paenibacillus sp. GSMTC-2017]